MMMYDTKERMQRRMSKETKRRRKYNQRQLYLLKLKVENLELKLKLEELDYLTGRKDDFYVLPFGND